MSFDRRACWVTLLAGLIPAGHADEVKSAAKTTASQHAAPSATVAKPAAGQNTTASSTADEAAAIPEVDDEMLEFLGGVDSATEDEDWLEYLSQADIAKAAKARTAGPAAPEVKKE
ncbi:MAG: hypothetical protein ABI885_22180 [Gammaproteobacteria bacterium]